jgi:hypothetical protein
MIMGVFLSTKDPMLECLLMLHIKAGALPPEKAALSSACGYLILGWSLAWIIWKEPAKPIFLVR